jgi:hypothetical protein
VMPPYGMRVVLPVEKDGGYKPMPHESVVETAKFLYSLLDARKQQGSFASVDYGNLTFPLSWKVFARLAAEKDDLLTPRVQALSLFYQQLSRMIIEQFVAGDVPVSLASQAGKKMLFTPEDLRGDYNIEYAFSSTSPEQDMANYEMAAAAQPFVSGDSIRRDILKLKDPDAESARIKAERQTAEPKPSGG